MKEFVGTALERFCKLPAGELYVLTTVTVIADQRTCRKASVGEALVASPQPMRKTCPCNPLITIFNNQSQI